MAVNLAVKFYLVIMPRTQVASGIRWHRLSGPDGKVTVAAVLTTYGVAAELALALWLLVFGRGITLGLVGGTMEGIRSLRGSEAG